MKNRVKKVFFLSIAVLVFTACDSSDQTSLKTSDKFTSSADIIPIESATFNAVIHPPDTPPPNDGDPCPGLTASTSDHIYITSKETKPKSTKVGVKCDTTDKKKNLDTKTVEGKRFLCNNGSNVKPATWEHFSDFTQTTKPCRIPDKDIVKDICDSPYVGNKDITYTMGTMTVNKTTEPGKDPVTTTGDCKPIE